MTDGKPDPEFVSGDHAPLAFFVDCSDTFDWGTADYEPLGPDDIDTLEQAFADVRETAGVGMPELDAPMLYCARRRGRRPMRLAYPQDTRLWPLFDAAGPVRRD